MRKKYIDFFIFLKNPPKNPKLFFEIGMRGGVWTSLALVRFLSLEIGAGFTFEDFQLVLLKHKAFLVQRPRRQQ